MHFVLVFHFMSVTSGEQLNLSVPQFLLEDMGPLQAPPMGLRWYGGSSDPVPSASTRRILAASIPWGLAIIRSSHSN